jgi:hypothetical protein
MLVTFEKNHYKMVNVYVSEGAAGEFGDFEVGVLRNRSEYKEHQQVMEYEQ